MTQTKPEAAALTGLTYADIVEGVRRPVLRYSQAMDGDLLDEVVALFTADGSMSIPDMDIASGAAELRELFSKVIAIDGLRHIVVSTLVTEWDGTWAKARSELLVLMKGEKGWGISLVGGYDDTLVFADGDWKFRSRVLSFVG